MITSLGICIYDDTLAELLRSVPLTGGGTEVLLDETSLRVKVDPRQFEETAARTETFLSELERSRVAQHQYSYVTNQYLPTTELSNTFYCNDKDLPIYADYYASICTEDVAYAAVASFFPAGIDPQTISSVKQRIKTAFSEGRIVFRPIADPSATNDETTASLKDYAFPPVYDPAYLFSFRSRENLILYKYLPGRRESDREIVVGEEIRIIGRDAFSLCKETEKIVFASEKSCFGRNVIRDLPALKELVLPSNAAFSVGRESVVNCPKLTTVTFGEGLQAIDKDAIINCPSLRDVVLPESMLYVDPQAFPGVRLSEASRERIRAIAEAFETLREEHRRKVERIRNSGASRFGYELVGEDGINLKALSKASYLYDALKAFHDEYDRYFRPTEALYYGDEKHPVRFNILAEKSNREDFLSRAKTQLESLNWKYSESSAFVQYCLVDTEHIPMHALRGESAVLRDVLPYVEAGATILLSMRRFYTLYDVGGRVDYTEHRGERAALEKEQRQERQQEMKAAILAEKKAAGAEKAQQAAEALAAEEEKDLETTYGKVLAFFKAATARDGAYPSRRELVLAATKAGYDWTLCIRSSAQVGVTDLWQALTDEGVLQKSPTEQNAPAPRADGTPCPPGEEPADIKEWVDLLIGKLKEAYPDKVVISLADKHQNWNDSAGRFASRLGYPDRNAFLQAYGFTVEKKEREKTDYGAILEEIRMAKYPSGPVRTSVQELIDDNPEYADVLRSLATRASVVLGKGLKEYCLQNGLLTKKREENIFEGVMYRPGEEPADIKEWVDQLVSKLTKAFPDKKCEGFTGICPTGWSRAATRFAARLGYRNKECLLMAYGFDPTEKSAYEFTPEVRAEIFGAAEEPKAEEPSAAVCPPGQEPEDVKKWIDLLFSKFEVAFPDKKYYGLGTTHKKWGESVTKFYRRLGYKDSRSFLAAYGYTPAETSIGGRPASADLREEALPERLVVDLTETISEQSAAEQRVSVSQESVHEPVTDGATDAPATQEEIELAPSPKAPEEVAPAPQPKKDKGKAPTVRSTAKEKAPAAQPKKAEAKQAALPAKKERVPSPDAVRLNTRFFGVNPDGSLRSYFGKYTNIVLPEKRKVISRSAFLCNSTITSVFFPEGYETIEEMAFSGCRSLTDVSLPSTLRTIGQSAFSSAPLKKIVIPDGCKKIGKECFVLCLSLTDIYVPASVTEICKDAFKTYCPKTVIHTPFGSKAHLYAAQNGIKFDHKLPR